MIPKEKVCTMCLISKTLDKFYKSKNGRFGVDSYCSDCQSIRSKKYRQKNADSISIKNTARYHRDKEKNKESKSLSNKKYRENNKEEIALKKKQQYEENKELCKQRSRARYQLKKKEIRNNQIIYEVINREAINAYKNNWSKERQKVDMTYKLNCHFGKIINTTLKVYKAGNKQGKSWKDILGYTPEDLKKHLELLFVEGMTWGNWGFGKTKWNIGHIKPKCAFYFTSCNDIEFRECWALSNLFPQWQIENFAKIKEDKKISVWKNRK